MADLVMEEKKKLGVNCPEFTRRRNEIMEMADDIQRRYKRNVPANTANTDRSK